MKKIIPWLSLILLIGLCVRIDPVRSQGGGYPSQPQFQCVMVGNTSIGGCATSGGGVISPAGEGYFISSGTGTVHELSQTYTVLFGGAGSCSIQGQSTVANPAQSCVRNSAGNYTITWASWAFLNSLAPQCTTGAGTSAEPITVMGATSSTSTTVLTFTTGLVATDAGSIEITCSG